MSESDHDGRLLSVGQIICLFAAGLISVLLSTIGSCCVVYVARKRAYKGEPYHRMVSLLSIAQIVFAASVVIGGFWIPKDLPGRRWAHGNMTICSRFGSVTTFAFFVISFLSAGLSIYFWLIVRWSWTTQKIIYWMEFPTYIITFTMSLGLAIAGAVTDSYNYMNLAHQCVITKPACAVASDEPRDYEGCILEECEDLDGMNFAKIEVLYVFCVLLAPVVGFTATFSVYRYVKMQLKKTRRKSMTSASSNLATDVSWQAIWYSMVYLNSFVWPCLIAVVKIGGPDDNYLGREGEPKLFLLQFLVFTFTPLSGLLIAFVYLRPKFNQWRMVLPRDESRTYCGYLRTILKKVLADEPLPRRSRRSTMMRNNVAQLPLSKLNDIQSNRQLNGPNRHEANGLSAIPGEEIGKQAETELCSKSNTAFVSDVADFNPPTQQPLNDSTLVNPISTGTTSSRSDSESIFQLDITL